MTQAELDALIAQHGGEKGRTVVGPDSRPDPDFPDDPTLKQLIPEAERQVRISLGNGKFVTVQPKADGTFSVVDMPTPPSSSVDQSPDGAITRTDGAGNSFRWDPSAKNGQGDFVPWGENKLSPEEKEAAKRKAQADMNERAYNESQGKGYITHADVAKLEADAADRGLRADEIKAARDRLANENKRLDNEDKRLTAQAERDANNDALANRREDRLTTAAEKQAAAEAAAIKLKELELDLKRKRDNAEITQQELEFQYTKEWNEVQRLANEAKLEWDKEKEKTRVGEATRSDDTTRRDQDLRDQDSQRDDATTRRSQDLTFETSTKDREQREADSVRDDVTTRRGQDVDITETLMTQAASIGKAGADTATASLPFMAPTGTAEDLASIRNAMSTGSAPPTTPARSVPFPWDPTQLVSRLTAQALKQMSPHADRFLNDNKLTPPASNPNPTLTNAGAPPAGGGTGGGTPPAAAAIPGANLTYQTVNGPRTVQQMHDELRKVGWGGPVQGVPMGPGTIANAYARTTKGAVNEIKGNAYGAHQQNQTQPASPGTVRQPAQPAQPAQPSGDPNAWFTEWQKRQAADVDLQRQQARAQSEQRSQVRDAGMRDQLLQRNPNAAGASGVTINFITPSGSATDPTTALGL